MVQQSRRRTDGRTTYESTIAIPRYHYVHRAVKTQVDRSPQRSHAFINLLTMGTPFQCVPERRSHAFRQIFNNGNGVPTRSPSK